MTQVTSRAAHSINCEVFLHTVTFFLMSYLGNCSSSAIVCFDDIATLIFIRSCSSLTQHCLESCLENTFCFVDASDILCTHRQINVNV